MAMSDLGFANVLKTQEVELYDRRWPCSSCGRASGARWWWQGSGMEVREYWSRQPVVRRMRARRRLRDQEDGEEDGELGWDWAEKERMRIESSNGQQLRQRPFAIQPDGPPPTPGASLAISFRSPFSTLPPPPSFSLSPRPPPPRLLLPPSSHSHVHSTTTREHIQHVYLLVDSLFSHHLPSLSLPSNAVTHSSV